MTESRPERPARAVGGQRGYVLRRFLVPAAVGAVIGLGAAVAQVSRAPSYLSDASETCINCHIMNPQYATWQHSAHANVATCNDCHVPHDNMLHQYLFKAEDGMRHSTVFTLRAEPQVIKLSNRAKPVVQANCIRCHEHVVEQMTARAADADKHCWDCHRSTPHGSARSLSATPFHMRPKLPSITSIDNPEINGRRARQSNPDKETSK